MDVINSLYKTKVDVRVSHKTHSYRRYLYSTEKRTCPGIQPKIDKDSDRYSSAPLAHRSIYCWVSSRSYLKNLDFGLMASAAFYHCSHGIALGFTPGEGAVSPSKLIGVGEEKHQLLFPFCFLPWLISFHYTKMEHYGLSPV